MTCSEVPLASTAYRKDPTILEQVIKPVFANTPTRHKNPYRLHHLALDPLQSSPKTRQFERIYEAIKEPGEQVFLEFLQQQGLAPIWDEWLQRQGPGSPFSSSFTTALHQARLHATGLYLSQSSYLSAIRKILDEAGIPHLIYKGAHTRERYYAQPALRPAIDIDLLVTEEQKIPAIKAFKREGYHLFAKQQNISHEVNLAKGAITVDLHWDIMRPGRSKAYIVDELLGGRQDYSHYWGMDDESTLFLMLVHPVFTKYLTTPQARLIRLIDIIRLLEKTNIHWDKVLTLLEHTGLKTAAWMTLKWLDKFTENDQIKIIINKIQPGAIRQKYLSYWLDKNLATLLLKQPSLVQLGFTLPAHDQWAGALQALIRARQLKRTQGADLQTLLEQTQR